MNLFLFLAAVALLVLVVRGRHHPLAGSGPAVEDRDSARLRMDLIALSGQAQPFTAKPFAAEPTTPRPPRHTAPRPHRPSGPRPA
jgi:hypothetical protein